MDGGGDGVRFPFEAPAPGGAVEVAEGVLWLRVPLPMRPDHLNAYALDEGDGWTIVDTGFDSPAIRDIWAGLIAGPLRGRPVRRVIVTHHHPDHVGLAGWFQTAHGAELWTTRTAWLFARMLTLDVQAKATPEALGFLRRAGMDDAQIAERESKRPFNFADVVTALPLGFRRIGQDDVVEAGGRRWRVEIGNGHAPEHATLWSLDDGLLLAGDQILPGITPNLGVYATEPEADTVGDWLASCRRLRGLADRERLALPGHRRPFTGVDRRLDELVAHQEAALERLCGFLDRRRRAPECFETLYGRRIPAEIQGLALAEAIGHLNHLMRIGAVERRTDVDGVWTWQAIAGYSRADIGEGPG